MSVTDLMQQCEPITRSFSFVGNDCWDQVFTHRRLILAANFKRGDVHIPLDGVPEKVRQQEETLFRSDSIVDIDFRPVEVSGQWIGNIARHYTDSVEPLQCSWTRVA